MDGQGRRGRLPEAQVEYGVMLFKGEGVAVDEQRAAKLFRLSAEQGNAVAQNRLARLYANGVPWCRPIRSRPPNGICSPARPASAISPSTSCLPSSRHEQRAAADKAAEDWRDGHLSE